MNRIALITALFLPLSCYGQLAGKVKSTSNTPLFQLPQLTPSVVYPNEASYPAPTHVASGGNLSAAVTAAGCGTVLDLDSNGSYSWSAFPALSNTACTCHTDSTQWVIIRSHAYAGGSVRGAKLDPSVEYTNLAHIVSTDTNAAFQAAYNGTSCYWFGPGLDIEENAGNFFSVINWGDANFQTSNFPHDMVVDHSYIHGTATTSLVFGINLNGNWEAVVDSYISDVHKTSQDTTGIISRDGNGPVLIQNNTIEGGAENTMFGGAASQAGTWQSDITIKGNYYFKPLSWFQNSPSYAGLGEPTNHVVVKNLIEFKQAQRVLVTGNIFSTTWNDGQHEFVIFNTGCSGSPAPVDIVQNVTFALNLFQHGPAGPVYGGCTDPQLVSTNHIYFHDNLYTDIDGTIWGHGNEKVLSLNFGSGSNPSAPFNTHDVWNVHETYASNTGGITAGYQFNTANSYGIQFRDSINTTGSTGAYLDDNGRGMGNNAISFNTPDANYKNNCIYGGNGGIGNLSNVANTQTPANAAAVFANPGTDWHVAKTSVCSGIASDGKDPGACIDCVNAAVAGVVQTLGNPVTVTNISPTTFTHLGSTSLTITGTNFVQENALGVIIGGAGPNVTTASDTCGSAGEFTVSTSTDTTHFKYSADACTVVTNAPITLAVNDLLNVYFTLSGGVYTEHVNRYTPGNACTSPTVSNGGTTITCTTPAASGAVTTGPVSVFVSQWGIPVQSTVFGNYN